MKTFSLSLSEHELESFREILAQHRKWRCEVAYEAGLAGPDPQKDKVYWANCELAAKLANTLDPGLGITAREFHNGLTGGLQN